MRASRKSRIRRERNAFFALLGLALIALVLPLPYMTVTASPNAIPVFDLVDRNRDGYIDRREASAVPGLAASFDKMDRNGDGRLDRVEYARW
jgi:EF hand domain-containing protein